jgi:hypothetical protein
MASGMANSQSAKFLNGYGNRFQFLDVGIHRMLVELQCLSQRQNFCGFGSGHHPHSVRIRHNNVLRFHFHTVAKERNVGSLESTMINRSRRNNPQRIDGKPDSVELGNVAHAAVNYRARKVPCAHEPIRPPIPALCTPSSTDMT